MRPHPTDVSALLSRLTTAAQRRGYRVDTLGVIGPGEQADPLLLLSPVAVRAGPRLLASAGFHGDEPAGCWGLLHFLENAEAELLEQVSLSLLPLVNPSGVRSARRTNDWGENPNAGFILTAKGPQQPSREGVVLIGHIQRLHALAADGMLTLHEDIEQTQFYLYGLEAAKRPSGFSRSLVAAARRFFAIAPDGPLEEGEAQDGILFNVTASAFEDLLFRRGVPRLACTETPGLLDFELRVAGNAALLEQLCRYALAPQDFDYLEGETVSR